MGLNRQDVWSSFDSRRNAKAGDGAYDSAEVEAAAANGPELIGQGVADYWCPLQPSRPSHF